MKTILLLSALAVLLQTAHAEQPNPPDGKAVLLYRIEFLDGKEWKPVKVDKKFKKKHTIRIRFTSNEAGSLYVLNTSGKEESLHPVFPGGEGQGLEQRLGMGTRIAENRVGLFPDPQQGGGGLRFTGVEGRERFLLAFIPDEPGGQREMLAIPAGAEDWDYGHKTTYRVAGDRGSVLFQYFELKSK